jgi:hypothetical protein
MPILSFKKQFVPEILSKRKQQTIRAFRKYPIKSGDKLFLYTALRTKYAKKIGEAICQQSSVIEIKNNSVKIHVGTDKLVSVTYQANLLNHFAKQDGFKDWTEMKTFWLTTHGLPFKGTLITWTKFKRA